MTALRFWAFSLLITTFLIGCNESPDPRPKSPPLPSKSAGPISAVSQQLFVSVTSKAAAAIRQIVLDQGVTEKCYLRLRVVPGGCQGFMHKLDLDRQVSPEDELCHSNGITVVVFRRQVEMFRGTQVDFGEVDGKEGFKIENPNFKADSAKKWLAALQAEKDIQ
jgi:iron-sulfur cluster assembly protein